MDSILDARGLSCPQPVLLLLNAIKTTPTDEMEVVVDNAASKENVIRAAQSKGWGLKDIQADGIEYHIMLVRNS
ncbi:MAG: sulfurtransferase TusA family protein [Desulfobacterales bacterium]